ncbi:MAG TPA: sulfite exporter TauE/SafE family protein [Spirillospora sp.]|nr:sulfite exporter TauE/SafE family protein [Spirillospora sp.]
MEPALLLIVILFASFTQSVAGFGLGLVAMPFIAEPLGVQPSTSLIALIALITRIVLLIAYREAFNLQVVSRLTAASILALPIGVLVLQRLETGFVLALLGVVVSGYALYALLELRLPEIKHPRWAYGFGFISGLLSGAYNTGGPPVIMYGTSRNWKPAEFKSNLQGFGLVNSLLVIGLHFVAHNYTPEVIGHFFLTLPVVFVGLLAGILVARFINPWWFRRIVLVMLLITGLTLIF